MEWFGNEVSLDFENYTNTVVSSSSYSSKTISETNNTSGVNFDELSENTKKAINYLYLNNNHLKNLKGFKNYTNVKVLRTEYNELETLEGIQGMTELEFLNSSNSNLGIYEKKDLKNSETDSLFFIVNCTKLKYLNLKFNKIVFIEYIKDLSALQYLYLANNPNFLKSSVSQIADLFIKLRGSCKSIDSVYNDYLTTNENFKYKNLENTSPEGKENYDYLVNLNSDKKLLVKYLDLSGSTLTGSEFNTLLSGYNGLIELNCTDCINLNTLDWVQGKTKLKQFLFENTAISGTEVGKLDLYATSLCSFKCNNSSIDLTKMQKVISRTSAYYGVAGYTKWCGAGINNAELKNELANCTEITQITTNNMMYNGTLDLSRCQKLTSGYFQDCGLTILPSCITSIRVFIAGCCLDLRNFKDSTLNCYIHLGNSGNCQTLGTDGSNNLIRQLQQFTSHNVSVEGLGIDVRSGNFLDYDLLSYLNQINMNYIDFNGTGNQENFKFVRDSWSGTLLNLKGLIMTGTTLGSLDFLQNNMKLENLSLVSCKIKDISGLKCYGTLKNLDLSNNQITNLENLSKFSGIGLYYVKYSTSGNRISSQGLVNLSNNPIEEIYKYRTADGKPILDDDGTTQKITDNLKELAELKKNATNLKTIILLPNELIKDYSPLTSIGWNKNTGNFE